MSGNDLLAVRDSVDGVAATGERLEAAVKRHQFGVIGIIDLQQKMRDKGVEFATPCRIYEVCNPHQAKRVLESNMSIATALPCRIVIHEEDGHARLTTLRPTVTLNMFGQPELESVAVDVESHIVAMMHEAASGA